MSATIVTTNRTITVENSSDDIYLWNESKYMVFTEIITTFLEYPIPKEFITKRKIFIKSDSILEFFDNDQKPIN